MYRDPTVPGAEARGWHLRHLRLQLAAPPYFACMRTGGAASYLLEARGLFSVYYVCCCTLGSSGLKIELTLTTMKDIYLKVFICLQLLQASESYAAHAIAA